MSGSAPPARRFGRSRRGRLLSRRSTLAAAWSIAGALGVAAALPAVWWEPLHVDEEVTVLIAPGSFRSIVHQVFVDKGGAPLHFFIEHATLAWPGGLEGLRLPSLLFFLLALPAAGLIALELCGTVEGLLAVPALALAPLAVGLATFGRMYALFLAAVLWSTWLALWAAQRGGRLRWALAGLCLGALVYVHPIAPLYAALGLLTGLLHAELRLLRLVRRAWPAAFAFVLAGLPYYLHALSVNRKRYGVYAGSGRLRTTAGRTIPEEVLDALAPGQRAGTLAFSLLALAGLLWLVRSRPRSALILGCWIVVPTAFFSVVPVGGTRFYDRYLLPGLPAFLLLAVVGCLAAGRLLGRRTLVGVLLVGALLGWEARDDLTRLRQLHALELPRLVSAVAPYRHDGVLFASAGRGTAGRPPGLLAYYVTLELPGIERVYERDCAHVRAFLSSAAEPHVGLWVFRGRPQRIAVAERRLAAVRTVRTSQISRSILLVRSVAPRDPRRLVEQGTVVRKAWLANERSDRTVKRLLSTDQRALEAESGRASCPAS